MLAFLSLFPLEENTQGQGTCFNRPWAFLEFRPTVGFHVPENKKIAWAQKLKLQLWARHYNCQLSLYSLLLLLLLLYSPVVKFWGCQMQIQAKGPLVHSMSVKSPNPGLPQELEANPDTRWEESLTFIKNWSVRNQINPSLKSLPFSRGHREVAQIHCWKIG